MLAVLVLRRISIALAIHSVDRVDWSKIRLPTFGWRMSAWAPRTKNSVLLSIAVHAALALIGTLFIVTKDIEHDYIKVEWVKIPRTLRRVKSPEVKLVKPRIIPPRDLATHQVTPTPKPVDVKVAARRSFSLVENSVDLSIDASEAKVGDVKTETRQAANLREVTLARSADAGTGRKGTITGRANAPGTDKASRQAIARCA